MEKLTVERVAYELAVSDKTLHRRFCAAIGHGVTKEIHRLRMETAKRLLRDGEISIARVAQRAGFGSRFTMNAAFHRDLFEKHFAFAKTLTEAGLVMPALEQCLKCSHLFNVLDASGGVGVTERTAYILRVRQLAVAIAQAYTESGRPAIEARA